MEAKTVFTARYAETDQMGIVHHSNYAVWFEAGRTDYLKSAGIPNSSIEATGVLLPLYEMSCKFFSTG
jgi:acyl-CoA thioester hydrolase